MTLINSYNGIQIGRHTAYATSGRYMVACYVAASGWIPVAISAGSIIYNSTATGGLRLSRRRLDAVFEYMWRNCEAFVLGRSDWEYVTNTFVFPAAIGYRFIKTDHGAANAQLCGIGADAAQRCVVVDDIQYMGLLITNGQFVAFTGDDPIEVVINKTCTGSVRLVNCAFWGPARQCVVSHSSSFVSLSDCFFSSGLQTETPRPLVEADSGRLQMRSCSFATPEPSVHLKQGLEHAIINGNNGTRGVSIINDIGQRALISNNEMPG